MVNLQLFSPFLCLVAFFFFFFLVIGGGGVVFINYLGSIQPSFTIYLSRKDNENHLLGFEGQVSSFRVLLGLFSGMGRYGKKEKNKKKKKRCLLILEDNIMKANAWLRD